MFPLVQVFCRIALKRAPLNLRLDMIEMYGIETKHSKGTRARLGITRRFVCDFDDAAGRRILDSIQGCFDRISYLPERQFEF